MLRVEKQIQKSNAEDMRALKNDPDGILNFQPGIPGAVKVRNNFTPDTELYRDILNVYLRFGMRGLNSVARNLLMRNAAQQTEDERRALSAITGPAGGYLIPKDMQDQVWSAMDEISAMRRASTILNTETGNNLEWPTIDDTANTGVRITENSQVTVKDTEYKKRNISSYLYSSGIIKLPISMVQDLGIDIEGHLALVFGERIGRIFNEESTNGTGNKMPTGVADAAPVAVTAASATAITYDEMVALKKAVPNPYRMRGIWMMNSDTWELVKTIKDTGDQPIFRDRLLLDHDYIINEDLPGLTSGNTALLFGDFRNYMIRAAGGLQVRRLTERYADSHQVAFLGFQRLDGVILNAGTDPIKALQMG